MASIQPKATGVIYTDGVTETRTETTNGVLGKATVANNPQWTPSKVAKDYIDDQKVFENDELAPAWPDTRDTRKSTPESA